tara:strand:- start:6455 stop:7306 length:852 start_codon:yes stop_codon:yes gene_type:complete
MLPAWFNQYMVLLNMSHLHGTEQNKLYHRAKPHYEFAQNHHGAKFNPIAFHQVHPPLNFSRRAVQRVPWSAYRVLSDVPESFDWRESGMVSPVLTQGTCNSCYAFTAADNLNYWTKKMTGSFGVSAQTLMDCTQGCGGGLMEDVFHWQGPYGSKQLYDGNAHTCHKPHHGIYATDYVTLSDLQGARVEPVLANAVVRYGPIPVGIDATSSRFITYNGGVITSQECNHQPNHAVTVVGYTPEYWIIKNSWGKDWGDHGYGKIARGEDVCGIDSYASFVTAASWR